MIPEIDRYLHLVIAIVVFLSILPSFFEWRKHRKKKGDAGKTGT
jgi:hypothetical protein